MSGMRLSVLVAAGIALVAAVGVFLWLPARAPEAAAPGGPGTNGEGDGDGDLRPGDVPPIDPVTAQLS